MPATASRPRIAVLVLSWFGASVLAISSAKRILSVAPCPATLCFVQFGTAALGARLLQRLGWLAQQPFISRDAPDNWLVASVSASYSSGFLLTNAAIAVSAPSLVETFKAAEPLSTVALAFVALREREHALTYASLVPIVVGVAIASSSPTTFSAWGMALSLLSNFAFSARAIFTKALKRHHPTAAASSSDAVLFYRVSSLGSLMLLPFALVFEARTLLRLLAQNVSVGSSSSVGSFSSSSSSSSSVGGGDDGVALLPLLGWVLLNGVSHAAYNGVSFAVLGRVSVSSHAVLNIVRRIVCIAAAAILFSTPVTLFNWMGVIVAAAGVGAFARSKELPRPIRDYRLHGKARAV